MVPPTSHDKQTCFNVDFDRGILDSSNSQNQFPKCLKQNGFCLNVLT